MKKIISATKRQKKKTIKVDSEEIDWSNKYKADYLTKILHNNPKGKGSRPRVLTLSTYLKEITEEKAKLNSKMSNYKRRINIVKKKIKTTLSMIEKEKKNPLKNTSTSKSKTEKINQYDLGNSKKSRKKRPKSNIDYIKALIEDYSSVSEHAFNTYDKYKELSDKFSLGKTCEFVEYMNSK